MNITILGCGTSSGVPLLGCDCAVCNSNAPKNKRQRVSILIEQGGTQVLVDTSPDLRSQLLDEQITRLDGVILTHAHADHLHGIDDLRSVNFNMESPIDVWGSVKTLELAQSRFNYAFQPVKTDKIITWSRPSLVGQPMIHGETIEIGNLTVLPFDQIHGLSITSGLRIGRAAYSTDVKEFPEDSFDILKGIELWIVDCVGFHEHPTHAHLELVLEWIDRVKPNRAVLTHMSHQFDYDTLKSQLPKGIEPAYDGMRISL